MGNNSSHNYNKIHHFIYIYVNNEVDIPNITTELLAFISPNIDLIKSNQIDINIFNITNDNLNNKEIVKLLKKNNIGKLPALKIKNKNAKSLYIGNADIINYYYNLFGNKIIVTKMQQQLQLQNQQGQNQHGQNQQGQNQHGQNQQGQYKQRQNQQGQNQHGQNQQGQYKQLQKKSQIADEEDDYSNYLLTEYNSNINDTDNDDDTLSPIGDNKNIMSKYDSMVKFRSDSNKTQHSAPKQYSEPKQHKHSQSHKKPNKSSITPDMLKDSPFRDGDLDNIGLDDNLDTISVSQSLKNINYKNNPTNNQFSLGDDDNDNGNDSILEQIFWEKNL
jgi:hypothetical protein